MRVFYGLLLLVCLSGAAAQTSINPDANNVFHITGAQTPTVWIFTAGGATFNNPTLNMTVGKTYYFSIEFDTTTGNHPFGLNTSPTLTAVDPNIVVVNNGSSCSGSASGYLATTGKHCVVAYTPTAVPTQPIYYHCTVHPGMVGQLQVIAAAAGTPGPTNPPTTGAPTPTSPPKGGASGLVPGLAAVVFAAVAAAVAH